MPHSSLCHQGLAPCQTHEKGAVVCDGWVSRDQLGAMICQPLSGGCVLGAGLMLLEAGEDKVHLGWRNNLGLGQKVKQMCEANTNSVFSLSVLRRERERETKTNLAYLDRKGLLMN